MSRKLPDGSIANVTSSEGLLLRLTDPPVYRPAALMAAQPKVSPAGNCAPPV